MTCGNLMFLILVFSVYLCLALRHLAHALIQHDLHHLCQLKGVKGLAQGPSDDGLAMLGFELATLRSILSSYKLSLCFEWFLCWFISKKLYIGDQKSLGKHRLRLNTAPWCRSLLRAQKKQTMNTMNCLICFSIPYLWSLSSYSLTPNRTCRIVMKYGGLGLQMNQSNRWLWHYPDSPQVSCSSVPVFNTFVQKPCRRVQWGSERRTTPHLQPQFM